jgi:hypothetical protein
MRLSPTSVLKYECCPRQYYLDEVLGIRPLHKAANLVFGGVVHGVVEAWLRGWLQGRVPDAGALFEAAWQAARAAGGIDYSTTQSPDSLTATGRALVEQFAAAWPGFGLLPALDGDGEPLLERKLEVRLAPGVVFVGKPDIVTLDGDGAPGCLDFKTPSSPTDPGWLTGADQLTGYQLLLDAHAERLGIPPVARLGLLELVKRKVPTKNGKGPEVCPPVTVARRAPDELVAYAQKVRWAAEDIDRGRFPKRSLMAHNSPCGLCAFRGLCQDGDTEGLTIPDVDSPAALAT